MSYSTWNVITIEGAAALSEESDERRVIENYADQFGLDWDEADGNVVLSGQTKYMLEGVASLSEYGRTTHYQEYDYDEAGKEEIVFENGAIVSGRVDRLVPDDLDDLIATVRKFVRRDKYGDVAMKVGRDAGEAVMALLDALDEKGN